ncbi:MAG: PTS glucose transporter subunit IIA [Rothia sp. (in: high G+C Gram-positive bacteria)]|nr:PTS glucose transporter subunit IIA [Rothia sp. (in: high G+C Gram-positive bacteria)]
MAGFFKKLFGGADQAAEENPVTEAAASDTFSLLAAHMQGRVLELSQVSDPMFASGALGPGAAIEPLTGQVLAPARATVTVAFPTGHAFGLRTEDGLELLIHVGFDTVELDGKFFDAKVEKGQLVEQGQVLVDFDLEQVKAAGYQVTTPLVVTNAKKTVADLSVLGLDQQVQAGDDFLKVDRLG